MTMVLLKVPPALSVAFTMQDSIVFTRNEEVKMGGRTVNQFGAYLALKGKVPLLSKRERTAWAKENTDATEEDVKALLGKSDRITQKVNTVYCWSFLHYDSEKEKREWIDCDGLLASAKVGMRFCLKCLIELTVTAVYPGIGTLHAKDHFGNTYALLHIKKDPFMRMCLQAKGKQLAS